jgi:hypothetical protein
LSCLKLYNTMRWMSCSKELDLDFLSFLQEWSSLLSSQWTLCSIQTKFQRIPRKIPWNSTSPRCRIQPRIGGYIYYTENIMGPHTKCKEPRTSTHTKGLILTYCKEAAAARLVVPEVVQNYLLLSILVYNCKIHDNNNLIPNANQQLL